MAKIVTSPVQEIIRKIDAADKNGILLLGKKGSGKSTILREYAKKSTLLDPIIDVSSDSFDFSIIKNIDIFNLCHLCLILQKMLNYIKLNYSNIYMHNFVFFNEKITSILDDIIGMISLNYYSISGSTYITKDILYNPEILLNEFLRIAINTFEYNTLTLILDDFDVVGKSNSSYQKYIYETLKKHLRVIATVSDNQVINNKNITNRLNENNYVVSVSYNLKTIKYILDSIIFKEYLNNKIILPNDKRVKNIFLDATIEALMKKCDNNLFDMICIMKDFYSKIDKIDSKQYNEYLLQLAFLYYYNLYTLHGLKSREACLHIK